MYLAFLEIITVLVSQAYCGYVLMNNVANHYNIITVKLYYAYIVGRQFLNSFTIHVFSPQF